MQKWKLIKKFKKLNFLFELLSERGVKNGILIATVNHDSPIGKSNQIFVGDQILEVSAVSITSSEFNVFANIYKNATSPVEFVVQSLQTAKVCYIVQGSIYGRRDHCQSEYDHKHSEPEICKVFIYTKKWAKNFVFLPLPKKEVKSKK